MAMTQPQTPPVRNKKVAILQSNYIPWKGYFDLIAAVDEFIFYDDVQYTKNDWRNRNKIKTTNGIEWLSVPVGQNIRRTIREVMITTHDWQRLHWTKLYDSYKKTPYFHEIATWLEPLYLDQIHTNLSAMNQSFIRSICAYLGIRTHLSNVGDYTATGGQTERLVALCQQAGAQHYISGPAAKDYLDTAQFAKANIQITWFDYCGYPPYPQDSGAFQHGVSILDLLFHCGKDAPKFMQIGQS